ncbi:adenosine deaminase [Halioxenophilus sp. WMMB6]|uniref:adenosine deaminase n=1 Tax=Halioxenophilus sp. WMMB6 TaxID=3073815 RepID=UPI00295E88F3|nr:adenosine deaminase [Halioxenophilus sp. WMMB6]
MADLSDLIAQLPKTELHIHIEGSLEPAMVMALAARNGVTLPYQSADELAALYDFDNLQSFLDLYYQATDVLQTEQDFFDLTWAYLERCAADRVVHTEIFFDPQSHTSRGVSFGSVIGGITAALAKGESELGISNQLIMCFLRHLPEEDALATWAMAQPYLAQIAGVGLDSSEHGFPPELFQRVFAKAKAAGLKCVAHAGEEGPAEYIEQALDLLHVDRIDHGVRITESEALMTRAVDDNMALTVCPLSNVRLCVYPNMADHPLLALLDRGLRVMINSDDPAYFGGYLNRNYAAVAEALQPTAAQLIQLVKNSFLASFLPAEQQQHWLAEVDRISASLS